MKYLFVNNRPYVVGVPTPTGGSIMVPPRKFVQGVYFLQLSKQTRIIEPVPELTADQIPKKNIVYSQDKLNIQEETTVAQQSAPVPVHVAPVAEAEPKKSMEETMEDAMRSVRGLVPTGPELDRMSLNELKTTCENLQIIPVGKRVDLIKLIKGKIQEAKNGVEQATA